MMSKRMTATEPPTAAPSTTASEVADSDTPDPEVAGEAAGDGTAIGALFWTDTETSDGDTPDWPAASTMKGPKRDEFPPPRLSSSSSLESEADIVTLPVFPPVPLLHASTCNGGREENSVCAKHTPMSNAQAYL